MDNTRKFTPGQIIQSDTGSIYIVIEHKSNNVIDCVDLETGTKASRYHPSSTAMKKVANSAEEYYTKKFESKEQVYKDQISRLENNVDNLQKEYLKLKESI